MAADIFSRDVAFGGSFSADGIELVFDSIAGAGFLVQQMGVNYRQQVNRVYELGSGRVYIVAGRTQGNGSLTRLIGPKPLALAFYQKFGDVCKLQNNHITASMKSNSCGLKAGSGMTMRHCLVEGMALGVNAGDYLFNEQSSTMFLNLEMSAS